MGIYIAAVATILLFGAFVCIAAWLGLLAGSVLFALAISLIVLGASALISAVLAVIFRIREGAHG